MQQEEQAALTEEYQLNNCPLAININISPPKQGTRTVVIGIRNHQDVPLMFSEKITSLEDLPLLINSALAKLNADLPNRLNRALQEAVEKKNQPQVSEVSETESDPTKGKSKKKKNIPLPSEDNSNLEQMSLFQ
ncbi:MAG TPA: hypothetical protein VK184_09490 [Nostocaceae cyanobacterium]|nr:hypothetical protein [Nostocaceae cyanobacterium]